ncbi:Tad domain-containing protein [Streptomyces sp. NBC_01808]|uniref:TadE/TadG family type IV pilus assembly protein n=1 Tax=Streptomyces sp. NBC_01808 TaxID=2975947 RepID=UPI002DDBD037|nr:Tad domain-containing protein [Streptomyces sp. NBC_01808]WSA38474.1 Tad domain-containing protein [Streptomyces sp. NBC_01808]
MTRVRVRTARLRAGLAGRVRKLDDRGSGAGAVIIFAFLFMALAAFVVDGGLAISQRERAADIAEQAARYAAQDTDKEALYEGQTEFEAPIRHENCDSRVQEFMSHVTVHNGDVESARCTDKGEAFVEVEIVLSYRPLLTGLALSGPLEATGKARAEPRTEVGEP